MTIWAIADLHLSFGTPDKKMDVFGGSWENHAEKIEKNWIKVVGPDDLVLIAGDISWAMNAEQVAPDLAWLERLPGTKVMIRGNHDYWWGSISKVRKSLPPSCHALQNDAFLWKDVAIGGTRLWDSKEISTPDCTEEDEKIFERELGRLEMSLKAMNQEAKVKIVMTHYPPLPLTMEPTRVTDLLESYHINFCLFGHLHNQTESPYTERGGIHYLLTACDFLGFTPLKVLP